MATNIKTDPKRVNKKNLNAEYTLLGPPHTPMIKNIGINPASKKDKKLLNLESKILQS